MFNECFLNELEARTFPLRELFYMPVRGDASLLGGPLSVPGVAVCFQV